MFKTRWRTRRREQRSKHDEPGGKQQGYPSTSSSSTPPFVSLLSLSTPLWNHDADGDGSTATGTASGGWPATPGTPATFAGFSSSIPAPPHLHQVHPQVHPSSHLYARPCQSVQDLRLLTRAPLTPATPPPPPMSHKMGSELSLPILPPLPSMSPLKAPMREASNTGLDSSNTSPPPRPPPRLLSSSSSASLSKAMQESTSHHERARTNMQLSITPHGHMSIHAQNQGADNEDEEAVQGTESNVARGRSPSPVLPVPSSPPTSGFAVNKTPSGLTAGASTPSSALSRFEVRTRKLFSRLKAPMRRLSSWSHTRDEIKEDVADRSPRARTQTEPPGVISARVMEPQPSSPLPPRRTSPLCRHASGTLSTQDLTHRNAGVRKDEPHFKFDNQLAQPRQRAVIGRQNSSHGPTLSTSSISLPLHLVAVPHPNPQRHKVEPIQREDPDQYRLQRGSRQSSNALGHAHMHSDLAEVAAQRHIFRSPSENLPAHWKRDSIRTNGQVSYRPGSSSGRTVHQHGSMAVGNPAQGVDAGEPNGGEHVDGLSGMTQRQFEKSAVQRENAEVVASSSHDDINRVERMQSSPTPSSHGATPSLTPSPASQSAPRPTRARRNALSPPRLAPSSPPNRPPSQNSQVPLSNPTDVEGTKSGLDPPASGQVEVAADEERMWRAPGALPSPRSEGPQQPRSNSTGAPSAMRLPSPTNATSPAGRVPTTWVELEPSGTDPSLIETRTSNRPDLYMRSMSSSTATLMQELVARRNWGPQNPYLYGLGEVDGADEGSAQGHGPFAEERSYWSADTVSLEETTASHTAAASMSTASESAHGSALIVARTRTKAGESSHSSRGEDHQLVISGPFPQSEEDDRQGMPKHIRQQPSLSSFTGADSGSSTSRFTDPRPAPRPPQSVTDVPPPSARASKSDALQQYLLSKHREEQARAQQAADSGPASDGPVSTQAHYRRPSTQMSTSASAITAASQLSSSSDTSHGSLAHNPLATPARLPTPIPVTRRNGGAMF